MTKHLHLKGQRLKAVISVLIVMVIGSLLIVLSHATTPYASVDTETGSLSSGATVQSSSQASGGQYVQFGSSTLPVSSVHGQMGVSPGVWEFNYNDLSASAQQSQISTMISDGVKWIRLDVDLNFGDLNIIKAAQAAGINVDAILEADSPTTTTPSSVASEASTVVAKLKPFGVHTYEVLNEPNGCAYQLSASSYTAILKAVYPVIKAADSSSTVLSGGLCPNSGSNEPYTFLTAMYAAGAHGYFDAMNDHPYSWPDTPYQTTDSWNPWSYLPQLHNIMVANNDGNKLIWLTEYGCPTGSLNDGFPSDCTEAQQVEQITDAAADAKSMPYTGPLLIYDWEDAADDFGLYNSSDIAKPALAAFKAAAAQ